MRVRERLPPRRSASWPAPPIPSSSAMCGRGERSLQRLAAMHMHEHERRYGQKRGPCAIRAYALCLTPMLTGPP
ncbi:hypothetical protein CSPX01_15519, partial [Colletotrichum filicis]